MKELKVNKNSVNSIENFGVNCRCTGACDCYMGMIQCGVEGGNYERIWNWMDLGSNQPD